MLIDFAEDTLDLLQRRSMCCAFAQPPFGLLSQL